VIKVARKAVANAAFSGSAMLHKPLGLLAELTHRCPLGCPLLLESTRP
jgi:hypothetical protein